MVERVAGESLSAASAEIRHKDIHMGFTFAPLLIFNEAVPERARDALKAAVRAPHHQRKAMLESAARVLYLETDLDCLDAREIVGLDDSRECA
jgi:hypothetical protein